MSDALYDTDILVWSEQQAELLRRAARGERVNGLDWPNLIEEIESVGRSEQRAVRSNLRQALVHLLTIAGWPSNPGAAHWAAETRAFLGEARDDASPSIRNRLDLPRLYADALRQVRTDRIDAKPPAALPPTCPFNIDDLLGDDPDPAVLAQRLAATAPD